MIKTNIHDAKTNLSKYLEKVQAGETVVLCRHNVPVAEIHRIEESNEPVERPLGLARQKYGQLSLSADFFKPLPQSIIDAFSKPQ